MCFILGLHENYGFPLLPLLMNINIQVLIPAGASIFTNLPDMELPQNLLEIGRD